MSSLLLDRRCLLLFVYQRRGISGRISAAGPEMSFALVVVAFPKVSSHLRYATDAVGTCASRSSPPFPDLRLPAPIQRTIHCRWPRRRAEERSGLIQLLNTRILLRLSLAIQRSLPIYNLSVLWRRETPHPQIGGYRYRGVITVLRKCQDAGGKRMLLGIGRLAEGLVRDIHRPDYSIIYQRAHVPR